MEGLYLYCIKEKSGQPVSVSSKGIDGKGAIRMLNYRGLEAVVSDVSLEEFTSQELQKKAQEDLGWIKEKAVRHETVIEEIMGAGANLLPMRFGVIFHDWTRIESVLEKNYFKIGNALDRVRGKNEWTVKLYLKSRKEFEVSVRSDSALIREKEREMAASPEGLAFFMEQEVNEVLSRAVDRELKIVIDLVFSSLDRKAASSHKNKILARELTSRPEIMILNAAYLVAADKLDDFKREAEILDAAIRCKGFCVEYCGPWPNYSFSAYE